MSSPMPRVNPCVRKARPRSNFWASAGGHEMICSLSLAKSRFVMYGSTLRCRHGVEEKEEELSVALQEELLLERFFFFLGAVFLATLGTFKGELGLVFSSLVERRRLLRRVGEGEGEGDAMVKTCLGGIQL